jgi:hypothetical protein
MLLAKVLKALEENNCKVKKLLVVQVLDIAMMRELFQIDSNARREELDCRASEGSTWVVGAAGVQNGPDRPQDFALPVP